MSVFSVSFQGSFPENDRGMGYCNGELLHVLTLAAIRDRLLVAGSDTLIMRYCNYALGIN